MTNFDKAVAAVAEYLRAHNKRTADNAKPTATQVKNATAYVTAIKDAGYLASDPVPTPEPTPEPAPPVPEPTPTPVPIPTPVPVETPRGSKWGVNIGWVGRDATGRSLIDDFKWRCELAKELGVKMIRWPVPVGFLYKTGVFNANAHQPFDTFMQITRDLGLDVLMVLQDWPNYLLPSKDPKMWGTDAGEVAAHFNPYAIEIWNEPNGGGWNPKNTPEPKKYTHIAWHAYDAIKANAPQVKVIAGALSVQVADSAGKLIPASEPIPYLKAMYEEWANICKYIYAQDPTFTPKIPVPWDAISTHPYSGDAPPMTDQSWNQYSRLDEYHAITKTPLWLTELGYRDQRLTPDQVSQRYRELAVAGDAYNKQGITAFHVIYELINSGTSDPSYDTYGLVDFYGKKKPAFDVVSQLMRQSI